MLKSVCNQIVQCPSESWGDVSPLLPETEPGSKASCNPQMKALSGGLGLRQPLTESVDVRYRGPLYPPKIHCWKSS